MKFKYSFITIVALILLISIGTVTALRSSLQPSNSLVGNIVDTLLFRPLDNNQLSQLDFNQAGLDGEAGTDGVDGEPGPRGSNGPPGPPGADGSSTAAGARGPRGLTGAAGSNGVAGPAGPAGSQGATGATGPQGPQGPAGSGGSASCPNGSCVSLQAVTPGVAETGNINISGTLIAGNLQGNGANLTNVNATQLNGQAAAFYQNATNINAGTLADARLSGNVSLLGASIQNSEVDDDLTISVLGSVADGALTTNVTLQGNTFNGASQLVQLTAGGILPVLSGANLTNVNATQLNGQAAAFYQNATNINAGTLADARLSGNVALLNASQSFTGANIFQTSTNSVTGFEVRNSATTAVLTVDTLNSRVGIGTSSPNTTLDLQGAFSVRGMSAPAVSPAGQGRIYFDSISNTFKASENGGAFANLIGGGSASAFVQGGNTFGATASLGTNDNFGLNFRTNNVDRVFIGTDGKVGINTSNPLGGLHILNVGTTADRTSLVLDTTSADFRRRGVVYSTNGVARWQLDVDNVNEAGGNSGSIFGLNTYADDGTYLRNAFAIRRESGDWNVLPSVSGDLPRFGIGVTASGADVGSKLHVRSTLGNAIKTTNITSSTNSVQNAFNIQAETSGVIANGFGNQILFQIKQGSGGTANTIAGIATERNGANNSGDLILKTSNAGSLTERLRIDSSGNVGIGATNPGNLLSVGALTTADASAKLAVGTGGAANEGIIIQAVASQTADLLQAQDSTGAVLAKIDATGNLTVKAATINGTLTVNGHIVSGNTTGTTTIAAGAAACTTPTVSIAGNDTAGTITVTTGTGCAATGTLATVTFASAYGVAPTVTLTPANASGAGLQYYSTANTTTFTLDTNTIPTDSTTYQYYYQIIQ